MTNCKYCKADCAMKGEDEVKECRGYIPMTNADRIRAMTDEELAVMFAKLRADLPRLDRMVQPYSGKDVNDNYDWLQQSYGGADHG